MKAKRWMLRPVLAAAASAAMFLSGCGGGGSSGDATGMGALPGEAAVDASSGKSIVATGISVLADFLNLDPSRPIDYETALPEYFKAAAAASDNTPANAPTSSEAITLGRVLFYDTSLSANNTISCASCHQQDIGFADDKRFSLGFSGTDATTAHAMRLANLRFYKPGSMFWNKRAASLEAQASKPLQHPVEMGFDPTHGGLEALLDKMRTLPYYPELFRLAFGDATITEDRMQAALAQFMRRIVSVNSRWDSGYAKVYDPALPDKGLNLDVPGLTIEENRGRHLFMAPRAQGGLACAACHVPPTFALAGSGSNGLDAGETTSFKSPSLKNVDRSSAFMHDGRFSSLEQVVEHSNSGVKDGKALDRRLKGPDGTPLVLNLAPEDKAALAAFLRTLSDPVLAANPVFTNPFRK